MQQNPLEVRRAFGLLFIGVSIAVGVASILSEIVFVNKTATFYYGIIWFGSFGITFGIIFGRFRKIISSIKGRMKNSVKWSRNIKAVNGVCWAAPFAAIGAVPSFYQYLILLGIGLGNLSTYLFMKKYSGLDNREQIIVAIISLVAIPIAIVIDSSGFITSQTIAVITSRILIAIAYGAGGIYALTTKK
ncbi:MAG TPA: hypothetical protein VEU72_05260 [Nitrosopumilaceae archaeon]|nr:hypothetical protein [Nitrosopumilaceae archaeon]